MLNHLIRNSYEKRFAILACLMLASSSLVLVSCETEPKGGTMTGAAIGGLALAAAGSSPQAQLLLAATGALAGGAIGNEFVDKPAAEKKYQKDVQLAADQARAAEYAKFQAQRDIEEQRLFDEWKRQQAASVPIAG